MLLSHSAHSSHRTCSITVEMCLFRCSQKIPALVKHKDTLTCTSRVPSGTLNVRGRSGMVGAPVSLSFHSYSPSSALSSLRLASLEPSSSGLKRTSRGVVTLGGSTGAAGTRHTCSQGAQQRGLGGGGWGMGVRPSTRCEIQLGSVKHLRAEILFLLLRDTSQGLMEFNLCAASHACCSAPCMPWIAIDAVPFQHAPACY